jgi:predicted RNA binding protein with dsRBD fold (UPF0201 family)
LTPGSPQAEPPRVRLAVEAKVSPSEDPAKVARAVESVVGDAEHSLEVGRGTVRLTAEGGGCLDRLRDQLRDRHVRSAARRLALKAREGKKTTLMLNRQAAAAGALVLCSDEGESSLGPIYVTIESDDPDGVLDWLASYPPR